MKKNRGFTLIELLATIIILAGIALIAFPILLNTISNSEKQIDEATKKLVENAAKLYVDNNANDYPKTSGNTYCVSFDELIKSNHLEKGIIEATDVDTSSKVVKVTVSDDYNYEIVDNNACTAQTAKICTYDTSSEVAEKVVGAKYTCDVGETESTKGLTFYVLENNEDSENISLIMDRNIGDTVTWCISVDSDNSCNGDGALAELEKNTENWTVEVSLPTYDQIYAVNQSETLSATEWLYANLSLPPYGYWTSTASSSATDRAWTSHNMGILHEDLITYGESVAGDSFGVRPVITISKDSL